MRTEEMAEELESRQRQEAERRGIPHRGTHYANKEPKMPTLHDAKRGDILYRLSLRGTSKVRYFRPVKVIRTTAKMIVAKTLTGQELRFWKHNGYEVGSDYFYGLSLGVVEGPYSQLASIDKGREWK